MEIEALLNKNQYEAVMETDGPLLVLAGAGSGKTRVVTYKIAHLIKDLGVNPYNILAITFTNKAAGEMKERASDLLGRSVDGLWIGTFHSICVRILRKHYSSSFTIYDTADTTNLIKRIIKDFNYDSDTFKPKSIKNTISSYKNRGLGLYEFQTDAGSDYYQERVANVFEEYEKRLKEANALDFDDLILKTVELFRHNKSALKEYQEKFQYVFVDEYQDVNDIQYQFIKLISGLYNNITVVGDENQSIYAFRGANLQNILNFERDYKDAKVIYLNENYRSTTPILNAANHLIVNNYQKYKRELFTSRESKEPVTFNHLETSSEEAFFVANKIEELNLNGTKYSDIAILYRTNAQSRAFEEIFMRSSIPYQIIGGTRFYDRKEVKDIIAYLRLFDNPHDTVSFERIINTPRRGVGAKGLSELLNYRLISGEDFFNTCVNSNNTKVRDFGEKMLALKKEELTLKDLVDKIIDISGYVEMLKMSHDIEDESRLQNIDELKNYVMEYQNKNPEASLADLLSEISLLSDIDSKEEDDKITLMTIHSAKGLEFSVVFVVGLEEGLFPSIRSIESEADVEEERRLCYVAITRAKDLLFLTAAKERFLYGSSVYSKPSRFIEEIEEFIETMEQEKKRAVKAPNEVLTYSGYRHEKTDAIKNEKKAEFADGDVVMHKMWGEGRVVSVSGDDITIVFNSKGLKKLKLSLAPISKKMD